MGSGSWRWKEDSSVQRFRRPPAPPARQGSAALLLVVLLLPLCPSPPHPPSPSCGALLITSLGGAIPTSPAPRAHLSLGTVTPAHPCPRFLAASKFGFGDCVGVGGGKEVLLGYFLKPGPTAAAPVMCVQGGHKELAHEGAVSFPESQGQGPVRAGPGSGGGVCICLFGSWPFVGAHSCSLVSTLLFLGFLWVHVAVQSQGPCTPARASSSLLLGDTLRGSLRKSPLFS